MQIKLSPADLMIASNACKVAVSQDKEEDEL